MSVVKVGGPDFAEQEPIKLESLPKVDYKRGGRPDGKAYIVEGRKWQGFANIAHPNDQEIQMPDLSSDDVQNEALYDQLKEGLSTLLKNDAQSLADTDSYNRFPILAEDPSCGYTECFSWQSLTVVRCTYTRIDAKEGPKSKYAADENPIAKLYAEGVSAAIGPEPSVEAYKRFMAAHLLNGTWWNLRSAKPLSGGKALGKREWEALLLKAHSAWFDDRQRFNDDTTDNTHQQMLNDPKYAELYGAVVAHFPAKVHNKRRDWEEDNMIAEKCVKIDGKDLVILRDKNFELIAMVAACAANLISQAKLDEVMEAVNKFAWRFPMYEPEPLRHQCHEHVNLRHNPEWDPLRSNDPHRAVSSVDHMGVNHEYGRADLKAIKPQAMNLYARRKAGVPELLKPGCEFSKLKHGPVGLAVKLNRLFLEALDPGHYAECVKTNRLLSKFGTVIKEEVEYDYNCNFATTGPNPYHYVALLVRALTEGHYDGGDRMYGLAGLMPFDDYKGSRLVLKHLGLSIEYSSGCQALVRGGEFHHFVTQSTSGSRYCVVLTNKESVTKCVIQLEKRIAGAREDWLTLRHKSPLTDLEQARLAAAEDDDAAVAGQLFREERDGVQASQQAHENGSAANKDDTSNESSIIDQDQGASKPAAQRLKLTFRNSTKTRDDEPPSKRPKTNK